MLGGRRIQTDDSSMDSKLDGRGWDANLQSYPNWYLVDAPSKCRLIEDTWFLAGHATRFLSQIIRSLRWQVYTFAHDCKLCRGCVIQLTFCLIIVRSCFACHQYVESHQQNLTTDISGQALHLHLTMLAARWVVFLFEQMMEVAK